MKDTNKRIEALRRWMAEHGAAACVIPQANPHLGEYVEPHWQARAWFSGFTGSAGTLALTDREAGLWTDSRYFLQAEEQLAGTPVTLMRSGTDTPWDEWLEARVQGSGKVVAADARLFSCRRWNRLAALLPMRDDASFEDLWTTRPPLGSAAAFVLPERVAGARAGDKLAALRREAGLRGERRMLLTSLDNIGWLLNLRGGDLEFSPLLRCFLLVDARGGELFAQPSALDSGVKGYLDKLHIKVWPYESLRGRLESLPAGCLAADFAETPAAVMSWTSVEDVPDPVPEWKAHKNAAELRAMRRAMLQDGVMWVKFLRAFAERRRGAEGMRESDVGALLKRLKSEREGCWGESFGTIAAAGDHGAVVHYAVTPESDRPVGDKGLLLIDTGTQYEGATTDMTRVLACGPLTAEERRDCTMVMKAHIALASAVFPDGVTGAALDGIARGPLWKQGLDFGHGTGHGVGAMLNVHEDPVRVSWVSDCPFEEGMVTSDEPGLYRAGKHGVRLENLLAVERADETEFGCFLKFNVLTLCPFDVSTLCPEYMTDAERGWLNAYHRRVKEELRPLLDEDENNWLNEYAYEI